VALEPPVLVTVSDRDCLFPRVTLPKLRLVGFDPIAPGATPVPDNSIVIEGFEASELIVTLPLALPLASGAKETVSVVLWEALSVNGVEIPLSWNPAPLKEACEMFTLDPPVLDSVTICDCFAPTVTVPKPSLAGVSVSCPGTVPVPVPIPERVRFVTAFDASLEGSRCVRGELDANRGALASGDGNWKAGRDQRKILS
jgi:hypothetical protein